MELYTSAGLGAPLGLLFLFFVVLNLFGDAMGTFGRKFIFEMDVVMGGLLGIPNYSKLEAMMIIPGVIGTCLLWSRSPLLQFLAILGLMCVDLYLLICVAYGVNARQPTIPFIIPMAPITAIIIWRCVSFLNPVYYTSVIVVAVVGIILSIICHFIMKSRRAKLEPEIQKLKAIQRFEKSQKAVNPDWKMEWLRGNKTPEGFEDVTNEKRK